MSLWKALKVVPWHVLVAGSLALALVIAMSGFGLPIFSAIYFSICAYITLETIAQELDERHRLTKLCISSSFGNRPVAFFE